MSFDIESAKREGYSDAEIAAYLAGRTRFDLEGARKEGYDDGEIIAFLTRAKPPNEEEIAAAERPARMTLTPGGQPQLEAETTQTDTGPGPDAVPSLVDQWSSVLKPAGARPRPDRRYEAANEAGRQMLERQNRSGTAAELGEMAKMDVANELASTDFWRGVGASLQSVPSDWKMIMGGAMRFAGEALPEEQPGRAFTDSWNTAKQGMATIGADFYDQGSREVAEAHRGLKPEFGAQAVGTAIRSLGTMLPVLATGGLTGSPAVVIGLMSGETGAKSYGEARDQGLDPGQAATYALLQATIEGGTEYLPIKALFRRDLTAGRQFLNFMVREVPSEEAATVLQAAVDKVSLRPDMTMRELLNDMAVTAVSTPLAGAGQVGAVRAMRAAQVDLQARREAETAATVERIGSAQSVDEAIAVALRSQAADEARSAAEEAIASLPSAVEAPLAQQKAAPPVARPTVTGLPDAAPGVVPAPGRTAGLPTEVGAAAPLVDGLAEASQPPVARLPAAQEQRGVEGEGQAEGTAPVAPQAAESTPVGVSSPREAVLILGKPVGDLSDAQLRIAAGRAATVEQRQAASEELARRRPAEPTPVVAEEAAPTETASDAASAAAAPDVIPDATGRAIETEGEGAAIPDVPDVVYRGVGREGKESVYGPVAVPILGEGRYFAFSEEQAKRYGPTVEARALRARQPLVVDSDAKWRALTKAAGWEVPNPFGVPEERVRGMVASLRDVLRKARHDAVVVTWPENYRGDILPDGRGIKLLRNVFDVPQVFVPERAPRATAEMPYIRGIPAEEYPLRRLELMAKAGNAEIKAAAQVELRRRGALAAETVGQVEGDRNATAHAVGVAPLAEPGNRAERLSQDVAVGESRAGANTAATAQGASELPAVAQPRTSTAAEDVRIFGKPLAELTDRELAVSARAHRMAAFREAARQEIARRADVRGVRQPAPAATTPESPGTSGRAPAVAQDVPATAIDTAAHEAAASPLNPLPEPTAAQKDAGNYKKGHIRVGGLDISIENPQGSERSGSDANGKSWSVVMKSHYGYALDSVGYDKDHVDTFVKPGTPEDWRGTVFVVNQAKANGHLDEHKALLGWSSEREARAAYLENYEPGWEKRIRSVVPMPLEQFKAWATDQSKDGPAGGDAQPVRVLGKPVDRLTGKELDIASRKARTPAMRAAAQVELDRRAEAHGVRQGQAVGLSSTELDAQGADFDAGGERSGAGVPPTVPPRGSENAPVAAAETADVAERQAVGILMTPPYAGAAVESEAGSAVETRGARPDAIRQAVRDLLRVPINEGGFKKSRDTLGIYKLKPQTIRVRNQNDIGVIAHETGHHFSETSRPVRELMKAHEGELRGITPYAAGQKTAALQREEGFADYLRLRWTQPAQARAKAPGFSAAFEEYVDDNGYRKAFDAIEGAIGDWQNLPPAERILAKVGDERPDFRKRFNVDRIIFEVFDNWLPLKRMVADLKPDIAPSADPFKLAHLLSGDSAIIEDWLLRETTPFDFKRRANVEDRGQPLAEILKPIEDQEREFGAYLIAKRANELMRRGKEHLYSADEIAAGLKLETSEFKKAAEAIYKYQDELLQYAVEGGLLSPYVADKFRQFPFYVPFFRVGEPIGQRGDIFKQIRGGTENLRDPIANIIENTVRVIHATNRNFVIAKAHDLARTVPGGGRWLEDVPMPERAVKLQTEKIIDQLREQGIAIDTETAEAIATTQTFFVQNPFGDERERIIVTRRSGKPRALQINDDMLWHALERFEPTDMGVLESVLSVPADILRAGIVFSPDFMARNFARDTLSGFIQSKKGLLPIVGTVNGFKEILTRSDAARLYRAFGGAYGDMWRADHGQERVLVERMARHGGFDPRTILTPRGLLSIPMRLGSLTEAGTRVGEFKKTMEPGDIDSLIDAAYNAREVSVDFGMHGHSRTVRFLTRITPFMNPALQGWYKAARTGKTQPLATVFRGGMLTLASILLYLNNKDEDWYQEIEQWEKNTYWHLDIGLRDPEGQVIPLRLPKPFEWGGFFGSIPEALAEVAIKQHGEKFGKRLASIVDDVFTFRVVPSAIVLPTELWANRNQFTGRPIVPESKERLAPELQTTPGTSLTAKKAGALMDASPAKIDHAVRGLFGTLGTYTVMLADQALRLDDSEPKPLPLPWQRTPLVKVFLRDPSGANSQQVIEFYELLREARRAEQSLKYLPPERMEEYYRRHQREIDQARSAEKVSRFMARLRKDNDEIRSSHDLPNPERLRIIAENNRAIRWLARDYMKDQERAAGAR